MESMLHSFDKICSGGGELLLVPGFSGVGKTALIQKLREPVLSRNGFFCQGKFNQYQQNIPYSAIQQAMYELWSYIAEDCEKKESWRSLLTKAAGDLGQLLIDLVPEFEDFLGPQPPVAPISPIEARHRFITFFQNILKVFCSPEHPFVLFLDDWQWADIASLELLRQLSIGDGLRYLLVIAAYRDNEIDEFHPFSGTLRDLHRQGVPLRTEKIKNLSMDDVGRFVEDSTRPKLENSLELIRIVHDRTKGNPFFMHSFVRYIYDINVLNFDSESNHWVWSGTIQDNDLFPDNVVDMFARQFGMRDSGVQNILSLAACLGNQFSLSALAKVSGLHESRCLELLGPEIQNGSIFHHETATASFYSKSSAQKLFRFAHDRVQQAAFSMIDSLELPSIKLNIGRSLLKDMDTEFINDHIFEVADHMIAGMDLIESQNERLKVIEINRLAARKARSSTAYNAELQFHRASGRLLNSTETYGLYWENSHDAAITFYLEWAESEFLEGDQDLAEKYIQIAENNSRTSLEKAETQRVLIVQQTLRANYPEAIAAGRSGLAALGINLPYDGFEVIRDQEIREIKNKLKGRSVSEFFDQPEMMNPEMRKATQLLITMGPPCYRAHQRLWSVLVPKVVNIILEYGNMPEVGYSHTALAGLLIWMADDFDLALQFKALAGELMTRVFDSPSDKTIFYLMIGSSARHWFHHMSWSSKDYADAYEIGSRYGNLQYAAYAFGHNMYCSLFQGKELDKTKEETVQSLAFSRSRHNQWAIDLLEGGIHILDVLASEEDCEQFSVWEPGYLEQVDHNHNIQVKCIYKVLRSFQLLMFDEFEKALKVSDQAAEIIYTVGSQGLLPWPEHLFIRLLILTNLYSSRDESVQVGWLREINVILGRLKRWADHCPDNYQNKYLLASAEVARIKNQSAKALREYEGAIEASRKYGFTQWEGFANEQAARFFESREKGQIAHGYLQQAYSCYDRWGARAKLRIVRERFERKLLDDLSCEILNDVDVEWEGLSTRVVQRHMELLRSRTLSLEEGEKRRKAEQQADELAQATEKLREEVAYRKKIEADLRESEERFRLTFDRSPIGAALLSLDSRFMRVNKTLCRILGYTGQELVSMNLFDLTHPEYIDVSTEQMGRLLAGEIDTLQIEKCCQRRDGGSVWIRLSVNVIKDHEGSPLYNLAKIEDITEQKKAEEKLVWASREARAASEAKSLFLANMSHEIRTPLNGIMGMLQLLQESNLEAEQKEFTETALQSSRRLNRLLSDILDLSKVEVGTLELGEEVFSIAETVESVTQLFKPVAQQKGLKFRAYVDTNISDYMQGDVIRLQQVLSNLVGNAIKFTEKGEVSLDACSLCSSEDARERVLFIISDTGIGVSDDKLETLFDSFTQVEGDYKRQYQGAGLGLAISKELVSLMEGNISVVSELNKGTSFYVTAPFKRANSADFPVQRDYSVVVTDSYRILLAEDEKVSQLSTRKLLERQGHEVIAVDNGKQALEVLQNEVFDLILMDVQMPIMDGLTATQAIRDGLTGKENAFVPIIALTAFAMVGDREKFLTAGMSDYLAKPIEIKPLHEVLARVMARNCAGRVER